MKNSSSPIPTADNLTDQGSLPHTPLQQRLTDTLEDRHARQLTRSRRLVQSPQSPEMVVSGKSLLNFCSNDYLGLANDPRLVSAFQQGAERWGVGAGSSHLVCGHTQAHHDLEQALADFTGRESALLFSSGYAANMGTINGLLTEGDQIFQDRLNHASLLDGGWISRADFRWYDHADSTSLNQQLNRHPVHPFANRLRLVVSDGTFSMDGDVCPLNELVSVCQNQNATLMIDDAHGLGCYGERGQGCVDPQQFSSQDVPLLVGTLGKAFGTSGAFVAGDKNLIDYLVQKSRNYIYTTAMPAAIAEASLASVAIVREESWRREKLAELIHYFRQQALQLELPVENSHTAIQPIVIGNTAKTLALSQYLEEQGIWVSAIRPPTVPEGTSRLRVTITAGHSIEQIDKLLHAIAKGSQQLDSI